jgi:hypothetical protein
MKALLVLLFASPALATPKIDILAAKTDPAKPEVVYTVTVTKTGGNCDVRLEFGDGRGRNLDFGMATTRTLRYAYARPGNYTVSVKGTGKTPCDGAKDLPVRVAGAAAPKKAAEKKADKKAEKKKTEKKKAEKKKADKKSAPKKAEEPK